MKSVSLLVGVVLLSLTFVNGSYAQQPREGEAKKPPTYAQLLKEMDTNEDGKLAKSEIKGPLKDQFDTVDADTDGFITEEEFNNAPKPERRKQRQ